MVVKVPIDVAEVIRTLAPEHKRRIRAVLRDLSSHPHLGKPLQRELAAFHSVHVKPFRIIYTIEEKELRIRMIDRRETVYELLASSLPVAERRSKYRLQRRKTTKGKRMRS